MISTLDIVSITFMGMVTGISVAVAMLLNWRVQRQQPGVDLWALAYILGSGGLILVGLRDSLPGFLSVGVANALLTSYWCLIWLGIRRLSGQGRFDWLIAGLLVTSHFILVLYYLFLVPDVNARIVIYCLVNAVIALMCVHGLFRHALQLKERIIYFTLCSILLAHAAFNVIRLIYAVRGAPVVNLLIAEPIHKLAFVEGIVLSMMLACSLVVVSNHRLRLALEKHQEMLEGLASTDGLSGLSNRRHFMELATREIDRSRRYGRPLSLIMIDVDHFKSVNDNHGHQCGDEVIKSIGDMLRRELRDQDISSRIGGEEFAVLLPEASSDDAAEVAERLRMMQASHQTPCADGRVVSCTASFGITELTDGDATIYDMLPRADQALYAAKFSGRNRVMIAGRSDITDMIIAIN